MAKIPSVPDSVIDEFLQSSNLEDLLGDLMPQIRTKLQNHVRRGQKLGDDFIGKLVSKLLSASEKQSFALLSAGVQKDLLTQKAQIAADQGAAAHAQSLEKLAAQTGAKQEIIGAQTQADLARGTQRGDLNDRVAQLRIDRDRVQGELDQALAQIRGEETRATTGARSQATVSEIQAKGEETRATLAAQTKEAIRRKKKEAKLEDQIAQNRLDTPQRRAAQSRFTRLERQVRRDTLSRGELSGEIATIASLDAEIGARAKNLEDVQAARHTTHREDALRDIRRVVPGGRVPGEVVTQLDDLMGDRSGRPTPVQIRELRAQALRAHGVDQALAQQGLRIAEGGAIEGGILSLPGLRSAGQAEAQAALQGARSGATSTAEGVSQATRALRGARLGRLGLGGLAGGLLLALTGRGSQKGNQELPPLLQLQLMQQLQELQNQNALTESLVGSRASSAGRNDAQADLMRLQAMQLLGAGGGGGAI
jgi:hypothetical protein